MAAAQSSQISGAIAAPLARALGWGSCSVMSVSLAESCGHAIFLVCFSDLCCVVATVRPWRSMALAAPHLGMHLARCVGSLEVLSRGPYGHWWCPGGATWRLAADGHPGRSRNPCRSLPDPALTGLWLLGCPSPPVSSGANDTSRRPPPSQRAVCLAEAWPREKQGCREIERCSFSGIVHCTPQLPGCCVGHCARHRYLDVSINEPCAM